MADGCHTRVPGAAAQREQPCSTPDAPEVGSPELQSPSRHVLDAARQAADPAEQPGDPLQPQQPATNPRNAAEAPEDAPAWTSVKAAAAPDAAAVDDAALARHHESLRQRIMREAERDIAQHVPPSIAGNASGHAGAQPDGVARQQAADSAVRNFAQAERHL